MKTPCDVRNSDYPDHDEWDNCDHEWKEVAGCDDDNAVRCIKCSCVGERDGKTGRVYWPAT